jgi:endonuclease YncB( thermonuclease family)
LHKFAGAVIDHKTRGATMRKIAIAAAVVSAFALGAAVGGAAVWWWATAPATYTGLASVTDGDTIRINDRRIRFVGIDTPELPTEPRKCQRYLQRPECTEPAAAALHNLIDGKSVACTEVGRDRFGRTLGICFLGNVELNVWLIEKCLAHSPRNPQHRDPRYEAIFAARSCPPRD